MSDDTTTNPTNDEPPPEIQAELVSETPEEPAEPAPDTRLPHEIDPAHVYDTAAHPTTRTVTEIDAEGNETTREEPVTYTHQDGRIEPHPWQISSYRK